ncbi:MAG TPA: FUSC family protein, partial [Granulicella sp.]
MLSPQTRRVLTFAATTYLATILALFVAFLFDLQNPWWAMLTVFIAQPLQPLTGAIWAKSVYRVIGTVVGGILCVVLVPLLASYQTLLLLALGVWLGICVYAGSL